MTARRKPAPPTLVDSGPESSLDSIESELMQVQRDAAEFGSHFRQGGWRLGLLVARSVELGTGGPRSSDCSQVNGSPAKVSMRRFSELSGVSLANVSYYYKAWELAAEDGRCTRASELVPGQDDLDDQMDEDDDEMRCDWAKYMKKVRDTKKPVAKKDPIQTPSELSADESDEDYGDDSTEVEAEIGSNEPEVQLTRDEIVQADSQIQRTELLEVLESARALISRISRIGHVDGDAAVYMGQIASAALDLNTTANALAMQKESQPKRAVA